MPVSVWTRSPANVGLRFASVSEALSLDLVTPFFQPVLSARQRTIIGVEALARAPLPNGLVLDAEWLFSRAAAEGLSWELDQRCCEKALEGFAQATRRDDQILLLNAGSWLTAADDSVLDTLVRMVERHGLAPTQIGVEILETRIDDVAHVRDIVDRLRDAGFLIVLDDIGAGYSNLDRIALLKPDVLKVDRSLISGITGDFHKQETLKSLVGLSRRIGALVIAEGVETESEAMVALEFGADLLQGYLLGRPSSDATTFCDATSHVALGIEALTQTFKTYMVRKINDRKLQHRRYNIVLNEVLCHLANANMDDFDRLLEDAIRRYPNVECLYVLDGAGVQITETIWNPEMRRRQTGPMFRPAPRGADHSLKEYYYILLDVELQKYTTDPYISFASGNLSRTISTYFRDARNNMLYVLCIDVLVEEDGILPA